MIVTSSTDIITRWLEKAKEVAMLVAEARGSVVKAWIPGRVAPNRSPHRANSRGFLFDVVYVNTLGPLEQSNLVIKCIKMVEGEPVEPRCLF